MLRQKCNQIVWWCWFNIGSHLQAMLEAFVQSGPSAPTAGLPVMSELLKRMADLDEEEAEAICGLGTPVQQVRLFRHQYNSAFLPEKT